MYHGSQQKNLIISPFYKTSSNLAINDAFFTTEDRNLAQLYARNSGKIFEIVPRAGGGYIIDETSKNALNSDDLEEYREQLRECLTPFVPKISEIPEDFYPRSELLERMKKLNENTKKLAGRVHFFDDIPSAKNFQKKSGEEYRVMCRMNTNCYLWNYPEKIAKLINTSVDGVFIEGKKFLPIDKEMLAMILQKMKIIGVKKKIKSVSAGGIIEPVAFFNVEKIQEKENRRESEKNMLESFEELEKYFASTLEKDWKDSKNPKVQEFRRNLHAVHIDEGKILEALKAMNPEWKKMFESEMGLWEGHTLEEHTDTVLRNFEHNFALEIPKNLVIFMRLVILVHDFGKDKNAGEKYDLEKIGEILDYLGISGDLRKNILFMITDGSKIAHNYFLKKDYTSEKMKEYRKKLPKDPKILEGTMKLFYTFLVSDGGAYTAMSTTRRRLENGGYLSVKNPESFDKSFEKNISIHSKSLRLK